MTPTHAPTLAPQLACDPSLGPPPEVVEARFSSSGGMLTVRFDAATDQGGSAAVACDRYLGFPGAYLALCQWTSTGDAIVATLDSRATVVVGDVVTLAAGLEARRDCPAELRTPDGASARCACWAKVDAAAWAPAVLAPVDPPSVEAATDAPAETSACDGLVVSGRPSTGGGGRAFDYSWTATVDASVDGSLLLAEVRGQVGFEDLALSGGALGPVAGTVVRLALRVSNFLGGADTSVADVLVVGEAVPSVRLDSNSRSFPRSGDVVVAATASVSGCAGAEVDTARLAYAWVVLELPSLASASVDPRKFRAAGARFDADRTYALRCTVTDANGLNASAVASLAPYRSSLVAKIANGLEISVGADATVALDASPSFDPDGGDKADLAFSWTSCGPLGRGDVCDAAPVDRGSGAALVVATGALVAGATYDFRVTVRDASTRAGKG